MIRDDGWAAHSIWEHSAGVRKLYTRRVRDEAKEMTCAAQAADLLAELVIVGDSVLDVGCGTGYFFHSLRKRALAVSYFGIDATRSFIDIGRRELAGYGLDAACLQAVRIEDFRGAADHVVCMNVLSNLDNYHRPLERMLQAARKSLILRESITDGSRYAYVRDDFLDAGADLKVHVNAYDRREMMSMIEDSGFTGREVVDRRTEGQPEMVIGYPHYWRFLVAVRR